MKNDFIEEWKDIKGYEGYYMVSNLGRVYESPRKYIGGYGSLCSTGGQFMKPNINNHRNGRRQVCLCANGLKTQPYISDLVGKAFIINPDNKPEIDHILPVIEGGGDEVFNLRWVTRQENMENKMTKERLKNISDERRQKSSERMKANNPTKNMNDEWLEKIRINGRKNIEKAHIKCRKKVGQYTIDGELIRIYESINEAARLTNITSCNISNVLKGRQKTSGGFVWKYAE